RRRRRRWRLLRRRRRPRLLIWLIKTAANGCRQTVDKVSHKSAGLFFFSQKQNTVKTLKTLENTGLRPLSVV
ncbi:MAG: hypothetical protein II018_04765, partial [Firmicutes bacterium]|nr:hypothetical protein [Bacillota bacterium]